MLINRINYYLLQAETKTFYHGSKKLFPVGFVLKPQPTGYVRGLGSDEFDRQIRRTEKLLETFRPPHMISRYNAVFLVDDKDAIEYAGGYMDHVYKVMPVGNVEKSYLHWYSEFNYYANINKTKCNAEQLAKLNKLLDKMASNYWDGKPVSDRETAVYEYRCKEARIVKEVT